MGDDGPHVVPPINGSTDQPINGTINGSQPPNPMNGSTDQPINRSTAINRLTVFHLALCVWLAVLLLSSTNEVGVFATDFYREYLSPAVRDYGISSHEAQKFLHVVLFAVLGWLLAYANLPPRPAWVRGLVWSLAVGAVTEFIQLLVGGRQPLFSDVLLNGVTGALTCWLVLRLAHRRPARS